MTKKILTLLFLLSPLVTMAETLYVSDTLRVGIRTLPNNDVPSIAVVKSGVAVEVLQRKGSYIQIRTKSGVEGWVKGAYFSKKAPAAQKLDKALSKISSLEKEIKELSSKKPELTNSSPNTLDKIKSLESKNQALINEIRVLKDNPGVTQTSDTNKAEQIFSLKNIDKDILYTALGALIVLLCLGFLFGVSWHKSQVTKRLGGMSI